MVMQLFIQHQVKQLMKIIKNILIKQHVTLDQGILGFDDKIFVEQLQVNVLFFPFEIVTNGIRVFVAALGSPDEEELNLAGSGYCSSFHCRYFGKMSLIYQSINNKNCQIDIYLQ